MPTRGYNILDLVITKSPEVIHSCQTQETELSDRMFITIKKYPTQCHGEHTQQLPKEKKKKKKRLEDLNNLNFFHKKVNWVKIKEELATLKLCELVKGLESKEMITQLTENCYSVCKQHMLAKRFLNAKQEKKIPRDKRILMKMINRITVRLDKAKTDKSKGT